MMLSPDILESYKKAGHVAGTIRNEVLGFVKPGISLAEIGDFVEQRIYKYGGKPAFPVNISINDIAAHYTPSIGEQKVVKDGDLMKIDIGVHVDGYIGDLAATYCSVSNDLIKAAQKCLDESLKILKPGVTVAQIGEVVQSTAESLGVGVIANLTGHAVDKFMFHLPPSIPNIRNDDEHEFKEGDVIAIEPFVVPSMGMVREAETCEIYRYLQDRPVRMSEARRILEIARTEYNELPFAKRWLTKHFSPLKVSMAIKQLETAGALERHPVLREASGKPVAQAEDTIIIAEKPIITTRVEK